VFLWRHELRYREKQLYKEFLRVVEIPFLGRLYSSHIEDISFYARFLAIYAAK
jgi:hypothetical protein